jgi:hypothetical protein
MRASVEWQDETTHKGRYHTMRTPDFVEMVISPICQLQTYSNAREVFPTTIKSF